MTAGGPPRRNLPLAPVAAIAIRLPLTSPSTCPSGMSEPLAKTSKPPSAASSVASGRAAISRSTSATGIRAISVGAGSVPRRPPVGKAPDLARNRHGPRPGTRGDGRSPTGSCLRSSRLWRGQSGFVDELVARHPMPAHARVVDLGCGPADIPIRLVAALPRSQIVAVDASIPMLALGLEALRQRPPRVSLICARLPHLPFADRGFDAVISNSLLHHLPEPAVLWRDVARLVRPGGVVHVMDLFRPRSVNEAHDIVEAAAGDEDQVLRDDFFNSIPSSVTPDGM